MALNLIIGTTFLIFSGKFTNQISTDLRGNYITQYFNDDEIKTVFDALQSQVSCAFVLFWN